MNGRLEKKKLGLETYKITHPQLNLHFLNILRRIQNTLVYLGLDSRYAIYSKESTFKMLLIHINRKSIVVNVFSVSSVLDTLYNTFKIHLISKILRKIGFVFNE